MPVSARCTCKVGKGLAQLNCKDHAPNRAFGRVCALEYNFTMLGPLRAGLNVDSSANTNIVCTTYTTGPP